MRSTVVSSSEKRSAAPARSSRRVGRSAVLGALALTVLLSGGPAPTSGRTQDAGKRFARIFTAALKASRVATVEQST
ncbi:hypothetical protein GCM10008955_05420 [Deinococcus malanensis]|uniref:Uncharacterized protein n=1 Tax=Deinococcus malanensis TaxID=1706855 RepID=A0ABQ2EMX0_9DEIO|nr:hypothetical protein GCM10008955_05420 [Deinococcus malanensis]